MPDSARCLDTSHFHFHQKSPKRAVVLVLGHCIFLEPDQESSRRPRAKYLSAPIIPPTYPLPLPLPHATRLTYDPAPRTSDLPGKPLSKESRGHKEAQGRPFPGSIPDLNPDSGLGGHFRNSVRPDLRWSLLRVPMLTSVSQKSQRAPR